MISFLVSFWVSSYLLLSEMRLSAELRTLLESPQFTSIHMKPELSLVILVQELNECRELSILHAISRSCFSYKLRHPVVHTD